MRSPTDRRRASTAGKAASAARLIASKSTGWRRGTGRRPLEARRTAFAFVLPRAIERGLFFGSRPVAACQRRGVLFCCHCAPSSRRASTASGVMIRRPRTFTDFSFREPINLYVVARDHPPLCDASRTDSPRRFSSFDDMDRIPGTPRPIPARPMQSLQVSGRSSLVIVVISLFEMTTPWRGALRSRPYRRYPCGRAAFSFILRNSAFTAFEVNGFAVPNASSPTAFAKRTSGPSGEKPASA